jgi:hypothetical protein
MLLGRYTPPARRFVNRGRTKGELTMRLVKDVALRVVGVAASLVLAFALGAAIGKLMGTG